MNYSLFFYFSNKSSIVQPSTFDILYNVCAPALLMSFFTSLFSVLYHQSDSRSIVFFNLYHRSDTRVKPGFVELGLSHGGNMLSVSGKIVMIFYKLTDFYAEFIRLFNLSVRTVKFAFYFIKTGDFRVERKHSHV